MNLIRPKMCKISSCSRNVKNITLNIINGVIILEPIAVAVQIAEVSLVPLIVEEVEAAFVAAIGALLVPLIAVTVVIIVAVVVVVVILL